MIAYPWVLFVFASRQVNRGPKDQNEHFVLRLLKCLHYNDSVKAVVYDIWEGHVANGKALTIKFHRVTNNLPAEWYDKNNPCVLILTYFTSAILNDFTVFYYVMIIRFIPSPAAN